jgi:hypothetical protein
LHLAIQAFTLEFELRRLNSGALNRVQALIDLNGHQSQLVTTLQSNPTTRFTRLCQAFQITDQSVQTDQQAPLEQHHHQRKQADTEQDQ